MRDQDLTDRLWIASGTFSSLLTIAFIVTDGNGGLLGMSVRWSWAVALALGGGTLITSSLLLFRPQPIAGRIVAGLLIVYSILVFLPAMIF